ncbi:hypothetical protein NM688_g1589 [Phlebia brevispora]|uniref:Uncharacterized protein n=1 Tax=Phlebia brevispora TaxID=194682 RepID=A0ACC1TB33_9APHY|nr:hypothetical protein NM688_g1589 [Phlebia brevispora]
MDAMSSKTSLRNASVAEVRQSDSERTAQPEEFDLDQLAAEPSPPPDGGFRAWLVVLGAFGLAVASGGYFLAWGTFQAFYQGDFLSKNSASAIAWIGSTQYALTFMPGLISGRLFDLGYTKQTLMIASALMTICNFLVAECKSYYQVFLSQGLLLGITAGLMYVPRIVIATHWFNRKRPVVQAIISMGSAVGGMIYPIMFRQLEPKIGFRWTMRTFAFLNTGLCLFGIFSLKTRTPPPTHLPRLFALRGVLTSRAYLAYVAATFLAYLGLFTPLTYLTVRAEAIGIPTSLAFYLIPIVNGMTIFGRLSCGAVANKLGSLNLTIASTLLTVASIFAWAYVTSPAAYIAISCLYGFASGGFLGLFVVPTAHMGPVIDTGRRNGFQSTILSFGALIGPPISGAIQVSQKSFSIVGIYAGSVVIGSIACMVLAKRLQIGHVVRGRF